MRRRRVAVAGPAWGLGLVLAAGAVAGPGGARPAAAGPPGPGPPAVELREDPVPPNARPHDVTPAADGGVSGHGRSWRACAHTAADGRVHYLQGKTVVLPGGRRQSVFWFAHRATPAAVRAAPAPTTTRGWVGLAAAAGMTVAGRV